MASKPITVFIYLPQTTQAAPAGRFMHYAEQHIGAFAYGRKYITRSNALAVDPVALPLGQPCRDVTINNGLYGAFRDAAPDYWGRLVIAAERRLPPEALSEVDFLLAANATRVGNLDFRHTPADPEPALGPPHFDHLANILEAADKVSAGEAVAPHLVQLLLQGNSIGGARPKCTVAWKNSLWIAKFPARNDTVNLPLIEYATMTLAASCGISVPALHITSVAGRDILLVQRFDRHKVHAPGHAGWRRTGFLSALAFMQWDEADRLSWDYIALADAMRRYMPLTCLRELFTRMVFNILVRNTDDHPRNHGFLFDLKQLYLSPAYDIVPALTQPGVGTSFRLAMSLGAQGREANLINALSRAERFGLTPPEAESLIRRMVEITSDWPLHFKNAGVSARECRMLRPSFALSGPFEKLQYAEG